MGRVIAEFDMTVDQVEEDANGMQISLKTEMGIPTIGETLLSASDPYKSMPSAIIRLGKNKRGETIKFGDKMKIVVSET